MTIPVVVLISVFTGTKMILGLDSVGIVMMILTFVMCAITFSSNRTNILTGAVHLFVFLFYLMLIFER